MEISSHSFILLSGFLDSKRLPYYICGFVLFLLIRYTFKYFGLKVDFLELKEKMEILEPELQELNEKRILLEEELSKKKKSENLLIQEIQNLMESKEELNDEKFKVYRKYQSAVEENRSVKSDFQVLRTQLKTFQLSPHFLKNYLNKTFLRAKIHLSEEDLQTSNTIFGKKQVELKALKKFLDNKNNQFNESLTMLIHVLNYLLYSTQTAKIQLSTELIELKNFCRLLEINNGVQVKFKNTLNNEHLFIPPTLLFHFVENAIKHGYFYDEKTIHVNLSQFQNRFQFEVINPIYTGHKQKEIGGLGTQFMEDKSIEFNYDIINDHYFAKLSIAL